MDNFLDTYDLSEHNQEDINNFDRCVTMRLK